MNQGFVHAPAATLAVLIVAPEVHVDARGRLLLGDRFILSEETAP